MFGLYSRIAAAIVLAMFLAGVYWKGHTSGAKSVQVLWDADVAQRTAQALEAEKAARARESELSTKVRKVSDAYSVARKNLDHLAAASSDGLRNLEIILAAPAVASSSPVASSGNHGAGGLERELLGNCAAALTELGKQADRLEAKVVGLQEYIKALK